MTKKPVTDQTKLRKLRKENLQLRKALAKACDWAIDSADVIADNELVDPEDGEDEDFRATIAELRLLSKQPEAERHIARRKAREEEEAREAAERKRQRAEERKQREASPPQPGIGIDSDGEYTTDGKRW
jgi:hypothetical protein